MDDMSTNFAMTTNIIRRMNRTWNRDLILGLLASHRQGF